MCKSQSGTLQVGVVCAPYDKAAGMQSLRVCLNKQKVEVFHSVGAWLSRCYE
jgi:hypothetical protein